MRNITQNVQSERTELPAESEFDRQKRLFLDLPQELRERYHGRFVVSRDGVILDDDADLVALSHRFFEQHGRVPVYITRVGKPVRMRSPFIK